MFMIHLQHRFTNFRESGAQASLISQTTSNMAGCRALNVTTLREQQKNSIAFRMNYIYQFLSYNLLSTCYHLCTQTIFIFILSLHRSI